MVNLYFLASIKICDDNVMDYMIFLKTRFVRVETENLLTPRWNIKKIKEMKTNFPKSWEWFALKLF